MKINWTHVAFFLVVSVCGFAQEKKDRLNSVNQTGTVHVTVRANGPYRVGAEKWWGATLYNSGWTTVKESHWLSTTLLESSAVFFSDVPVGHYYIYAGVFIEDESLFHPLHHSWFSEYYNNASTQSGATAILVNASDTTRMTMDLEWTTFIVIVTNPKPFQCTVDGSAFTPSPDTMSGMSFNNVFCWRQSDVHTLGVDEYYLDDNNPQYIRYAFREWSQGGNRIQNYTVPAPVFQRIVATLAARFDDQYNLDVRSPYGHPTGSGWHLAWSNVTFSVEDSVIGYSDGTFAFHKPAEPAKKDSVLHLFDCWQGTGYSPYSGKNNPMTIPLNGVDIVETAVWKDLYPLVTQSNDTAMGTVSINPAGVWQIQDTTVVLNALPEKGCVFVKWEGSISDTVPTVSVKMDTSKTITAQFALSTTVPETPATGRNTVIPKTVALYQNYPNPFNPSTEIRFDVPERRKVTIEIYMLTGKRINVLTDAEYNPGSHSVTWNGTDADGRRVGSSIYLCRMTVGNITKICKLNLIK